MYTKENVSSLLSIYTGRVNYTKVCGTQREYTLMGHPLSNDPTKKMYKPTHPNKVVAWCIDKNKWRFLRPEGITSVQTEF